MPLAYYISNLQKFFYIFYYVFVQFPCLKCLSHSAAKLQLCGENSTHLVSTINYVMHNASSNARSHNK